MPHTALVITPGTTKPPLNTASKPLNGVIQDVLNVVSVWLIPTALRGLRRYAKVPTVKENIIKLCTELGVQDIELKRKLCYCLSQ